MGVVGRDDRERVLDTFVYPFSAVCCLRIQFGRQRKLGTGWMCDDERTVATAGHNLWSRGVWADQVEVLPGLRSGRDAPRWSEVTKPSQFWVPARWRENASKKDDWGLIRLKSSFGGDTDWLTPTAMPAAQLRRVWVNLVGYPSGRDRTMWSHVGRIEEVGRSTLRYSMDTTPGQSGSPLIIWDGDGAGSRSVGIHNYRFGAAGNQATRVTVASDGLLGRLKESEPQ